MLARMIRSLKLDSSVYEEVEHDQSATGQAMAVVVITALVGSVGAFFGPGGMKMMLVGVISSLVGWFLMSLVSLGIGKLLGGKADMGEVLRALGFATTPRILGAIPLIGWLLALVLGIIAWVQALRACLDLSTGKAILVAIISFAVYICVAVVLAVVFGIGSALTSGVAS